MPRQCRLYVQLVRQLGGRLGRHRQHQPSLLPFAGNEFCGYALPTRMATLRALGYTPPPAACTAGATRWAATTSPASTIALSVTAAPARPDAPTANRALTTALALQTTAATASAQRAQLYAGYSDHSSGHVCVHDDECSSARCVGTASPSSPTARQAATLGTTTATADCTAGCSRAAPTRAQVEQRGHRRGVLRRRALCVGPVLRLDRRSELGATPRARASRPVAATTATGTRAPKARRARLPRSSLAALGCASTASTASPASTLAR